MMATHDVNYAFSWADEIIILKDGRVLDQGDPVSVFSNKELLHDACLEQPAVLTLFDALCQKKILKKQFRNSQKYEYSDTVYTKVRRPVTSPPCFFYILRKFFSSSLLKKLFFF